MRVPRKAKYKSQKMLNPQDQYMYTQNVNKLLMQGWIQDSYEGGSIARMHVKRT